MKIEFDAKTNNVNIIGISINPKADEPSTSGKTIGIGYERGKVQIEGREATVAVNIYVPVKASKPAKKK